MKSITDYAGDSISISAIFAFFYEKYIWRWNPLEKHPRLAKKYSGYLISTFDDKKRVLELDLKQTLMTCKVHQKTEESDSDAISTKYIDINGRNALVYTYLNVPSLNVREKAQYITEVLFFLLTVKKHLTEGTLLIGKQPVISLLSKRLNRFKE
ncbi:hypothetical protein [Lactiplantibacillus plantarum]|uniref:hypothetical protein n=1 Tax=Lactiplantibacillus plantarum TaxID=1590 RepID=UPI000B2DFF7C|nr:hypothetical protein [Lactiplantibacillus plantarum]